MSTRLHNIMTLTAALIIALISFSTARSESALSPQLTELVYQEIDSDSLIHVVVFMDNREVRKNVNKINGEQTLSRSARIKTLTHNLKSMNVRGADGVEFFLKRNSSSKVIRYWIVPAFSATVSVAVLNKLAELDGVELVVSDVPLDFDEPVEIKNAPAISTAASTALNLLNVPDLWRKGYTGKGRLVCSFDTGVESTHPALADKWRGNYAELSSCWFSPINPTVIPYDNVGHGTHTMGIMLGSTGTDTIGVAPDAEWITAGVIDQGRDLNTTLSDIIEAFQWALNPDGDTFTTDDVPDVISNSWGVPAGILPACDETFWQVIDNVEAAGIVTIFAAGNEGPNASSIRNPADRASTPLNSFSVGAIDDNKVVAGFSSRGPSSCNGSIKPEIVAPGVAIYSATKGGVYKYMSGTSMAAPFISGLVALCRQYNPDATVEQIKNAMILAAEDLGSLGEDNNYGYGLVDASKLLDFLPVPSTTHFYVSDYEIPGDGAAMPGENFNLQLTLLNASANVPQINGQLVSNDDRVEIIIDQGSFFFGSGTAASNYNLFNLTLDNDIVNGDSILLELILEDADIFVYDTLSFYLPVGYEAPGIFNAHQTGRMNFTVSDFAQYGLAEGSIYNLAADGFRFEGSDNLLYEAGIILGRNNLQLSSSIRDAEGKFVPSDFTPESSLQSEYIDGGSAMKYEARYVDTYSEIQIPVTVSQVTVNYFSPTDDNFVIMKYRLVNSSLEILTGLCFGFMADFDLTGGFESVTLDENFNLLYQYNASGTMVGLLALNDEVSFKALANDDGKRGFTRGEQYDLIAAENNDIDSLTQGDMLFMVTSGPYDLIAGDSTEIAFAVVAGNSLDELYSSAVVAKQKFDIITAVEIEESNRPTSFVLHQNFPNPFNPTTTINFSLPNADDIDLEIFNMLGQKVTTLESGRLPAGEHTFDWNATDDSGQNVATGVYFYRLKTSSFTQTKKMVLLK